MNMFAFRGSYGIQGNVSPDQTPNLLIQLGSFDPISETVYFKVIEAAQSAIALGKDDFVELRGGFRFPR